MAFTNFRKETSERSDDVNWAKRSLVANTPYHYDGIEGCNENRNNVVTHLLERARVDDDGAGDMPVPDVLREIIRLETVPVLQRKMNFAGAFGLNLSYILYCDETESVWRYEFLDIDTLVLKQSYTSYKAFSEWIASIKGWRSGKPYREKEDLPYFDKALRKAGCAWPTNIDCFISDEDNVPLAILEFQNAKKVSVKNHCNNEYFLCKTARKEKGCVYYEDDIRRWISQEILRVQSGLRLFILTWAQGDQDFVLKEVERICFPELVNNQDEYKSYMHKYIVTKEKCYGQYIQNHFQSYHLVYGAPDMLKIIHHPPLGMRCGTFPFIYYSYKCLVEKNPRCLPDFMNGLIRRKNEAGPDSPR